MTTDALAPFNPGTLQEAMEMAKMLSSSTLIPTALRGKPGDVLVILMKGRELGLSPLQSLGEIYVIEGKPVAGAALKVALCVKHPDVCEFFRCVESTDKKATFETKRAGNEPVRLSWTLEDAQRANLLGKQNWKSHPAAMLRARCSSALATTVYPDLVHGLIDYDEADEIRERELNPLSSPTPPPEPAPTPPPVVSHAQAVKQAMKKGMQIVDVQEGETEEQAKQREEQAAAGPTVAERVQVMLAEYGAPSSAIRGVTKATTWSELTEEDIPKIRAALEAKQQKQAPQPEAQL